MIALMNVNKRLMIIPLYRRYVFRDRDAGKRILIPDRNFAELPASWRLLHRVISQLFNDHLVLSPATPRSIKLHIHDLATDYSFELNQPVGVLS
jgi:hypothetical protein